jgi:diadenylate cyclase
MVSKESEVIEEKRGKLIPPINNGNGELNDLGIKDISSDALSLEENVVDDDEAFLNILKIFSPGTAMRTALDDLLRARMGALIVADKEGLLGILEGGFRINCKFSPQKLVELSKMDGAIILSKDLKKILYSNVLLVPKANIKTIETGTRHKSAEKTSKQFKTIVVAVSERKNKISLYWGNHKHILESSSEILRRATETLQILEKQKDIFDDLMVHLNILEITDLTSTNDVCNVLQRMEIMRRITDSVKRYLVELGKEGIIVSMRLKELTKNINSEREMILRDYFGSKYYKVEAVLNSMNFDFLLDTSNILRMVFDELHDRPVLPQGLRILGKSGLLEKDTLMLINHYKTLDKIFEADKDSLSTILGKKSFIDSLKHDLSSLKERVLEGKKV